MADLTTDEHRALASAASALPLLDARASELEAELDSLAEEERAVLAQLREVRRRMAERGEAIGPKLADLKRGRAIAAKADARLRGLCPEPLRRAQLTAQQARDAAARVLARAREAHEQATVGGDQDLVLALAAKVAAAEAALESAEASFAAARAALDVAHEEARRGPAEVARG